MRTAGRLDMKIANPTYMRPLKTKFRSLKGQTGSRITGKGDNNSSGYTEDGQKFNLSAFNADKKMHGIRSLVGEMDAKLNKLDRVRPMN